METTATKIGMPMEEFIRLYYVEGPFELINGERKPLVVNVAGHGTTIEAIFMALYFIVSARQFGVVLREQTFVLSYTSGWVTGSRQPDVMFYRTERINPYKEANPDWKEKPYILVPDLVVEVVSPNDNLVELDEKVNLYLLDGVKIVWVADWQKRRVTVHVLKSRDPFTKQETHLKETDTLDGGEVIPGFEIAVAKIFE